MEFAIGFSQTAREYYKAQQRAQADQEAIAQGEVTPTDEVSPLSKDNHQDDVNHENTELPDNDPAQTIAHTEELSDDKQAQVEAKNGQSPFVNLSRAELLKRIGIN